MTDGFSFELRFEDLDWVPNFEKTRWFLVLRLRKPGGDGLNRLLTVCNETVEQYSQPPLYTASRSARQRSLKLNRGQKKYGRSRDGSLPKMDEALDFSSAFHISIAWALEQPSSFLMDIMKAAINDEIFESLKKVPITVDALKVKVGNIVTSISLPVKAEEGKNLFGV
jgi:U6 snRNA phosphodiesterase